MAALVLVSPEPNKPLSPDPELKWVDVSTLYHPIRYYAIYPTIQHYTILDYTILYCGVSEYSMSICYIAYDSTMSI